MKSPIVIIGIGELAGVFSHGFLRCGYPVYPVSREMNISQHYKNIPSPELVLITVQEHKLHSVLEQIPLPWQNKIALIQNELLPNDWEQHGLANPTVTIVWFEKKKNLELTNILYSPSYGPSASLISGALQAKEVPAPILKNKEDLLFELTRKATYILTVNIAGLVNNCKVIDLWLQYQSLATEIAEEIVLILESKTGKRLSHKKLIAGMAEGIKDCPDRYCLGRSAFSRLERVIRYAEEAGLNTPKIREIYQQQK